MSRLYLWTLGLVALSLAEIAGAAEALPDPISPAGVGGMQCYGPNPARKTCQSMAFYDLRNGAIINTARVLLAPRPLLVMETASPVEIREGAVCGAVRSSDLEAARFTVDGRPLGGDGAAQIRRQIGPGFAPILNRQVCTRYTPQGALMDATVTIDGVAQPALTQTVVWVSPADGYQVGP